MSSPILTPDACQTMPDIRAGIDSIDREVLALLGRRMRYIEAAARVKHARSTVRDEARKADVLDKVGASARAADFPEALARALYEQLVEASIAHEFTVFDALSRAAPEK